MHNDHQLAIRKLEDEQKEIKKSNALVLHHKKQFDTYAEDNKKSLNDMYNDHQLAIRKLEDEHAKLKLIYCLKMIIQR